MTVTAELKCNKCGKSAKYSSANILHDHLICQYCGKKIMVEKYLDVVNANYVNVNGSIMRRDPKVKMSKKERRRMKNENNLD